MGMKHMLENVTDNTILILVHEDNDKPGRILVFCMIFQMVCDMGWGHL